MRVVKIVDRTPIINENGDWLLFCMVQRGNTPVYGAIVCETMQDAFNIKAGQILDVEKVKFSRRINNICK